MILLTCRISYGRQAEISGLILIDSSWSPKVYVSLIPDFNQMYTASSKLIVAEGSIDSKGKFSIRFPAYETERLYRLHIIKKTDPVSTLIIGSEDENHVFFTAKNATRTLFFNSGGNIMDQQNVKGTTSNDELTALLLLIRSQGMIRDSLKNRLIYMAERSRSEIVTLLAIHSSFGLNNSQIKKIRTILRPINRDNPYGNRIFKEYSYNGLLIPIVVLILAFLSVVPAYRYFKAKRVTRILMSLSQRESSIIRLILEGKANKEIASELNIELSTVKTHVNNIYSKLKIGNRNDLNKYRRIFLK